MVITIHADLRDLRWLAVIAAATLLAAIALLAS